jgi:colanic acid/amylovoran biosynthesis protein
MEVDPGARITVFAHAAKAAARYYPDLEIKPMFFDAWPRHRVLRAGMRKSFGLRSRLALRSASERQFFKDLGEHDVVVYCGGGYINDSYEMTLLLDIIEATLNTGIPHVAYGHSIGPLRRSESASRSRELLNRFCLVTVRDEASDELLRRIGVEGKRVALLADAALAMRVADGSSLSESDRVALRQVESFKARSAAPLILMSVRDWRFKGLPGADELTRNLYEQLEALTQKILTDTDWNICFLSTCQGRSEYGYDDAAVASKLVERLAPAQQDRVIVSGHAFAPPAYPYVIARCADLVVSMRMHLTIFSLLGGVPFVALAYEQKSVELCRRLGMERYCHEVAGLDAQRAFASAASLYGVREKAGESLVRSREDLVRLSRLNAALMRERCA